MSIFSGFTVEMGAALTVVINLFFRLIPGAKIIKEKQILGNRVKTRVDFLD